ncbi:chorismate mutase 2-like isoform X2 [Phalaenopsis equestris]|uniref:chorismate mutase 2-like isoform X2 n=1 Tax=Phalaenopsis equestris TaxID=78828 RepID=UPI0009E473EC|nr:chorismate mutase 2-like isoform X2 [Phalaenopsis equestris]
MASSASFARASGEASNQISLKSVRETLIRQEDSIIFSLIERARHPYNAPAYDKSYLKSSGNSLAEIFVKEAEHLHAKAGRYQNPEEVPFFTDDLPSPLIPSYDYPQVLHPTAASVNINKTIWDMYFNELLPLFTVEGDDGNYASTLASDLAISRRIHYGKFVAEVKFRDAPVDYSSAIHDKDKDTLMRMLTFERVEEMVKRRVEQKAMVFGQEVTMEDEKDGIVDYKVNPSVVSRLYGDWIIPLTKLVEVDYLLRRLE